MTNKEIRTIIEGNNSKSAAMKELYNQGLDIKDIAKALDVRYNFVYNVISNYCRVNDVELRTSERDGSKKEAIIQLFKEGKSNTEISKELKVNYQYVYKICKKELAAAAK